MQQFWNFFFFILEIKFITLYNDGLIERKEMKLGKYKSLSIRRDDYDWIKKQAKKGDYRIYEYIYLVIENLKREQALKELN
jgi:hypothetical protein